MQRASLADFSYYIFNILVLNTIIFLSLGLCRTRMQEPNKYYEVFELRIDLVEPVFLNLNRQTREVVQLNLRCLTASRNS